MTEQTQVNPVERLNELRLRVIAGEEITKDESAEAVELLRAQRAKATKPAKEPTLPTNLNDLFKKS